MNAWLASNPWAWIIIALTLGGIVFKVGQWVGAVNTDRTDLKAAVEQIREDIKKLLLWLPSKTLDTDSPLKINDLGKTVSDEIDVPAIIRPIAATLRARMLGKLPYDIQELCFDFIRDEYKPANEVENAIKRCAYDHGIDRAEVLDVLAIELRDQLLAKPGVALDA